MGVHLVSDVNVKSVSGYAPEDAALLCAVGRLVCAWTMLEQSLEAKIGLLREGMGDVRVVGAREDSDFRLERVRPPARRVPDGGRRWGDGIRQDFHAT